MYRVIEEGLRRVIANRIGNEIGKVLKHVCYRFLSRFCPKNWQGFEAYSLKVLLKILPRELARELARDSIRI